MRRRAGCVCAGTLIAPRALTRDVAAQQCRLAQTGQAVELHGRAHGEVATARASGTTPSLLSKLTLVVDAAVSLMRSAARLMNGVWRPLRHTRDVHAYDDYRTLYRFVVRREGQARRESLAGEGE
jgi:hypothetical protein